MKTSFKMHLRRTINWSAVVIMFSLLIIWPVVAQNTDRPTFFPKRDTSQQETPLPPFGQPAPANWYETQIPGEQQSAPQTTAPLQDLPSFGVESVAPLLMGDPIMWLPHLTALANKHGLLNCVMLVLAVFLFQYVRTTQKAAKEREAFFKKHMEQSEQSDRRAIKELNQLSAKLNTVDQDIKLIQNQLSREILSIMSSHNSAVEKGVTELNLKLDSVIASIRREIEASLTLNKPTGRSKTC